MEYFSLSMKTASPVSTRTALVFLFSYLREHRLSLAIGFFVLVLVDGLQLIIPRIIQHTLDSLGNGTGSESLFWKSGLLILLAAVFMVVLRYLWRMLIVRPSRDIEEKMRVDMFAHLERLSSPFFNKTKTGDLMALFINDVGAVRMATGMALIGLFDAVFMTSLALVFMFAISPLLTLIVAGPLPLIAVLFVRSGKLIQRRFTAVQESFAKISSHTQESFSGIRVIKGFAAELTELERLREAGDNYVAENMRLVKIWGIIFPAITFMASVSFCLLIGGGGYLVLDQQLSIGQLIAFSFYINLLVWPMVATGWVYSMIQRGLASAKRILEVLHTAPDVAPPPSSTGVPPAAGDISFINCTFRYDPERTATALDNVTLRIPSGTTLGIVGKPGSGKSTLASLLFHLYPVERGMVSINGMDLNDIPLQTLRRLIGYVPQDSFLFSETILHNIAFGCAHVPDHAACVAAAKTAAVHDDIMAFKDGYDTQIGERGVTLSGGQKQRIALARALLIDAPILILDDALSAVDAATEKRILGGLQAALRTKTAIVIAHRISTVQGCDTIVVLDNGRIIEQGSHETLLKNGGLYSTLKQLQYLHQEAA